MPSGAKGSDQVEKTSSIIAGFANHGGGSRDPAA